MGGGVVIATLSAAASTEDSPAGISVRVVIDPLDRAGAACRTCVDALAATGADAAAWAGVVIGGVAAIFAGVVLARRRSTR